MKKIKFISILLSVIILILFLTITFAGCKSSTQKQLDVYVWEGYLPEEVIDSFEQETGIKLNISLLSVYGNDEMLALLKGGGGADILMPSHSHIHRHYSAGFALPLDLSKIKNYGKVLKIFEEQPFTRWDGKQIGSGEVCAIPYIFGTTGIAINTSKYKKSLSDIGWEVLLDPDLKGRVSSQNDYATLMLILDLLGIPRENLENDPHGTLEQMRDTTIALKNNVLKFYGSGAEISDLMKNEEVWVCEIWDGGGRALSQFDSKFIYLLPKTGGMAWSDTFMIYKESTKTDESYLFIDFMLRPEIAAIVTEQGGFVTTVEGAIDMTKGIDKDLYRFKDDEMAKLKWSQNYSEEVLALSIEFLEEITAVQ